MKTLFALLTLAFFLNVNVEASSRFNGPDYYEVQFDITDIKPVCPKAKHGFPSCMSVSTVLTVSAPLQGCLDKVVYSNFRQVRKGANLIIHAIGIAQTNPRSATARCVRQNIFSKKISVNNFFQDISIVNSSINY